MKRINPKSYMLLQIRNDYVQVEAGRNKPMRTKYQMHTKIIRGIFLGSITCGGYRYAKSCPTKQKPLNTSRR